MDFEKLKLKKADLREIKGGKDVIEKVPTGQGQVLDEGVMCDTLNYYDDGSFTTVYHSCNC